MAIGYLIFRGVSTNSLDGVYVSKMPSHRKASMRYKEYYVKGRDGALHVDEGFSNFDLSVTLVLADAGPELRQIVNAWADGTGKLITSDDLTHAYKASVKDEIRWSRVLGNQGFFDTAVVTFNCQPFLYEAVDSQVTLDASGAILNPGSADALPLIAIYGSGDATLTVAGYEITIPGMTAGVPVYLDCENGYVYTESGATTMTGDFPVLPLGQSDIVFGSGVSQVVITPHWRWV